MEISDLGTHSCLLATSTNNHRHTCTSTTLYTYTVHKNSSVQFAYIVHVHVFIVRCVGGSKAPPVLHSSYRTDFERDCAV